MGAVLVELYIFLYTCGTKTDMFRLSQKPEERSLTGDANIDSKEGSSSSDPLCSEAPQGATEQNSDLPGTRGTQAKWAEHLLLGSESSGNLEVLAERVGILDLQNKKKNCSGAAKKRARKTRLAEAPAGNSARVQPQQVPPKLGRWLRSSQTHSLQGPSTSGLQTQGSERPPEQGCSTSGLQSRGGSKPLQGPDKHQRSSRSTLESRQAKRPKKSRQLSYAKAAQEGLRMAIVCHGYPEVQVFRENFMNIQRAIGGLVNELSEEGFTPKLIDTYWAKGAAIVLCQDKETQDWLQSKVPVMKAWEGCMLEVFLSYKTVVAWFLGLLEDTECLFQRLHRLNQGLDTSQCKVYERKEEPNRVRFVLSIDLLSAAALEGMKWHPFSGVSQATFSLLSAKPEGRSKKRRPEMI